MLCFAADEKTPYRKTRPLSRQHFSLRTDPNPDPDDPNPDPDGSIPDPDGSIPDPNVCHSKTRNESMPGKADTKSFSFIKV